MRKSLGLIIGLALVLTSVDGAEAQTSSYGRKAGPAVPGTGFKQTYPAPAHPKPSPFMPDPAAEIPVAPEKYKWTVFDRFKKDGKGEEAISVFALDGAKLRSIGTLPIGEVVTLDYVAHSGSRTFYGVPWRKEGRAQSLSEGTRENPVFLAWLPAEYIKGEKKGS